MKEKLISILRIRRLNPPSIFEIRLALRNMLTKEKVALLVMTLVFFIGILGVWTELQKRFAAIVPVEGGTLREGIIGTPYLVNPVLSSTDADRDLAALVYAGLMKSDGKGGLEKNLAEDYSISENGLVYAFRLKENLFWHDGEKITADDIAFTVNAAKNPAIKSPIRANWEGVETEISDQRTVKFSLKKPYAPFLENTTLGILPKHIWKNATSEQFGLSEFNRQPIGAGPYKIKKAKRNSAGIITAYELKSFDDYALGRPFVPKIEVLFYNSESEMLTAYETGSIDSIGAISTAGVAKIKQGRSDVKTLTLPRIFGVFFNQNKSEIIRDQKVRLALDTALNKENLVESVLNGYGIFLNSPLPPGIIDQERVSAFNLDEAKNILEKNGWKYNEEKGVREKSVKGKPTAELSFSISTANTPELVKTAEAVKNAWQALGVKVEVRLYEIGDLNQSVIRPRDYESLLFGQVVGRDPDPFAFWHSSQRNDPGLNIALYANKTVDGILESARTLNDVGARKNKYVEFEKEIIKDAPAIFLYSPYYLYITPRGLLGFDTEMATVPAERFANVSKWHLYTARVWKIFIN
ncbi:MAG: ABC transporter substrate-binding protein [Patescibacteria group bacterium]